MLHAKRVVKGQVLANFFGDHSYLDIDPKSKQDINVVVAKSVLSNKVWLVKNQNKVGAVIISLLDHKMILSFLTWFFMRY